MKRKTYYFLVVLLLLACGEKKNGESDTNTTGHSHIRVTAVQFEQHQMALGQVQEKAFPEIISVNGMIDVPPENRAMVSAVLGGYIKRIPLLVGDPVKKGQLLAILENQEFVKLQQEYLETKEQLVYLQSEYERQKVLFDEKISSQKNYLKTESEYKTTNAKFKGLEKQLGLLNISPSELAKGNITTTIPLYAPISGNVTAVFVSKGAYVSPASPVLEIVDNSHIHLELSVFERDIMNIKKGQSILFSVPEASNLGYQAEVYLVGTTIDKNRTVKVHGHLKDEEHQFLAGMFVEANIIKDFKTGTALPIEAVVEVPAGNITLRLVSQEEGTYLFEKVKLEKGLVHEGYIQIFTTENLDTMDQFLLKGAFDLVLN